MAPIADILRAPVSGLTLYTGPRYFMFRIAYRRSRALTELSNEHARMIANQLGNENALADLLNLRLTTESRAQSQPGSLMALLDRLARLT